MSSLASTIRRIDSLPREHEYVFIQNGKRFTRITGTAWKNARKRSQLIQCRVHDLRHTFGRRLRAAGVCLEDREDLLGHKSNRITTHYSKVEVENLLTAVESIVEQKFSVRLLRAV